MNGAPRCPRSRSTTRCWASGFRGRCAGSSQIWRSASASLVDHKPQAPLGDPGPARPVYEFFDRHRSATAVIGAAVFAVALGLYALAAHRDPGQNWSMIDLQVYRWGGVAARQHLNVYDLKFEGFLSFTYTPLAVIAFELMSHLSLGALRFVITGASIAALLAGLWMAWGAAGIGRPTVRLGLTLALGGVALGLEPVLQTLGFGQINLLLMALVIADLCTQDRRPWKGAGVGLAAAIKLTPAIFIAYLLLTRRIRAGAVAAGTFAAGIGLGFVVLPAASRRFWLGGLFLNSQRVGGVPYSGNQSLNGSLVRLFAGVDAAHTTWLFSAALVGIAGLVLAAWASRRGEELLGIGLCALTALLVSPISWSHHWVWVVLLVPCAFRLIDRHRKPAAWIALAALLVLFAGGPFRLVWRVPHSASHEYAWNWGQMVVGNLYVILGLLLLAAAALYLRRWHSWSGRAPTPAP